MEPKRVLFLCTGNSCRSQMAEALVNAEADHRWKAFSAGSAPAGYVHPMALKVLEEAGIHHEGFSKPMDYFKGQHFDLIVTVCNDDEENCPVWLGKDKQVHLAFPDPAKASGSEEQKSTAFRKVREDMRNRMLPVLRG